MRGRRSRLKIAQSLQPSLQAPDRHSSHLVADESSRRCSHELLSRTLTSSQLLLTAAKKYLLSCLVRVPFFFYRWCGYNPWHLCVKAAKSLLCLAFSLSFPLFSTSFPWPRGAVSYLDAAALLWALIDWLCAPHSQVRPVSMGPWLPALSATAQSSNAAKKKT